MIHRSLLLFALLLAPLPGQSVYPEPYAFTTLAGLASGQGSTDGPGRDARFSNPQGVAVDGAGNLYVADSLNRTIRKISPGGVVTTLAGSPNLGGATNGTGSAARFDYPYGIAVDGTGNVYVTDANSYTVRKITPAGVVTTLAGSAGDPGSDDGTGSAARFNSPRGIAVDASGNVYVADAGNNTIRKITPDGTVTTLAGLAGNPGSTDGTGNAARFDYPQGVAVDGSGTIFVGEYNSTIRAITPAGVVTTLAGTPGVVGSADGTGAAASFTNPYGLAADTAGNIYVACLNNTIRKVTPGGVVTTIAGIAGTTDSTGSVDGTGAAARFNNPTGITVDANGTIFVADTQNDTIRQIAAGAVVTTIAGQAGGGPGSVNGTGSEARFYRPNGVAVDLQGNVIVADSFNHMIRKVTPAGVVTTLAGSEVPGSNDGTGTAAGFNFPVAVAVDPTGNIFVADSNDNTIRKVTPAGVVTTFAGTAGTVGSADGTGSAARFQNPLGLAVDAAGNVLVADTSNHLIRKITPGGVVSTFFDGQGGAVLYLPVGLGVDGPGSVYVAEAGKNSIKKISPAGELTLVAGSDNRTVIGSSDGIGSSALFNSPYGLAVDATGNVFVADTANSTIRKITSTGVVTTVAGAAGSFGALDGTGQAARFSGATYIAVDGAGTLYVADNGNDTIRKGVLVPTAPLFTIHPASRTLVAGYAVTLTAAANGWPAPTYQWQKDGVNIAGATGPIYAIGSVGAGDAGAYRVVATNSFGIATSNAAILTVITAGTTQADFNGDGKPDLIWSNSQTGERALWLMNGTNFLGASTLGNFPLEWTIAATGDFNGDGKPDIVWSNSLTGERALWLMDGTNLLAVSTLGIFPLEWTVAATGDFNGDGKPDIVWSNSLTGERALWLMDGTTRIGVSTLGVFPLEWTVAATGDFNGDGKPDLVWSNSITGERALWLMDGTTRIGVSTLGIFPLEWTVAGTADFNGDGKPDIIWSNSVTGERALWLMDGTTFLAASTLGLFPLEWTVSN